MKLLITILISLLLTSCAGGGLSNSSKNSYVAGSGSAVYIKQSDRRDAPNFSGKTLTTGDICWCSGNCTHLIYKFGLRSKVCVLPLFVLM